MKYISLLTWTVFIGSAAAVDLAQLPLNTWVSLKHTLVQPANADEKGDWSPNGWNKLLYDPFGKRVLFYDRWVDKKHGGYTIYGNCLFALDPATAKLSTVKLDNWTKVVRVKLGAAAEETCSIP